MNEVVAFPKPEFVVRAEKSKAEPCRQKRDKDGAPSTVQMAMARATRFTLAPTLYLCARSLDL